ncbi:hypothetical protein [Salinicola avicenniae]|uniref:hypothetical protein n=1 Tax=Salinicola avicenniae TaxID=2916836 RepID=UPI002073EF59|nr:MULTISPECIES: hypothetical protein [unclassified Salinicola]
MESVPCPYCREAIKAEATRCKHCSTTLGRPDAQGRRRAPSPETWWLPVPAIFLGLLSLFCAWALAGLPLSPDQRLGMLVIPQLGLATGLAGALIQKKGRRTAIAGCAISAFALIIAIGILI